MESDTYSAAAQLLAGLQALGYRGPLLAENYAFPDWFAHQNERRTIAAAFGETPISYESACIGVVRAGTIRGQDLVNSYRALGAPVLLEIDGEEIREWAVSRVEYTHDLLATFPADHISQVIAQRAKEWNPTSLLRAKNIGAFGGARQLNLFTGLLPELEGQIQAELDPLLRRALAETRRAHLEATGRPPSAEQLFRLIFWTLTAKVFHDRGVAGFATLTADPDVLLPAVARQYKTDSAALLSTEARQTAVVHIWEDLDFRNLSVEVLSQIWSTTLVDAETRTRLGIHRTPRSIVRYIIERIPFAPAGDDARIVFEPCCGSAAFLVGAMHALRQNLFGAPPAERHKYFVNHLAGIEVDPFGAEISTLVLTLADFPNPNGWRIRTADVFAPGSMSDELRRAGVVLCNPPFEDFHRDEKRAYRLTSVKKPAELLNRVLDDLHPAGVLGFVLPVVAVDGQSYSLVRERLAHRFENLDFTVLPDRAFEADAEVALLVATEPIPHDVTRVAYSRVNDDPSAWEAFVREQRVTAEYSGNFGLSDAKRGFRIPDLPDVWKFLRTSATLGDLARLHRGIEWRFPLDARAAHASQKPVLMRSDPASGYRKGVPPRAKFAVFETPEMAYLNVKPEDQLYTAWKLDWDRPKAILNKSTRSRGNWRIAAFADREGVVCYQTFVGVWPADEAYDEIVLTAVLNSPVANAFVATREGKTDITLETLRLIPMPILLASQREALHDLVGRYIAIVNTTSLSASHQEDPELLLKHIDALVLEGYRLPARLERRLLDFFQGQRRPVAHEFGDYFPADFDVFLSLSEYLDPKVTAANAGTLRKLIQTR